MINLPANYQNPCGCEGDERQKLLTPVNPLWMELEEITIAEALKSAGYTSGHVGKWHIGLDEWFPEKQGFDFNAGGCDYGEPPSFFDPYVRDSNWNWISKETIDGIPTLKSRKAGEYPTDREAIYWHYPHYTDRTSPFSIIRTGDWKQIKFYENDQPALYNTKKDWSEENDLVNQFAERVTMMENK